MLIFSSYFQNSLKLSWPLPYTFLQKELYIRYSFQGNCGISLLTFHWGAFTKEQLLPYSHWRSLGTLITQVRKFLGKGSRAQDDPQAGSGALQGCVLWSSIGVTGPGARGHLLVGQVERLLLSPDKPLPSASMKQSARFHHYWPVCWVTDFIKNFNFLNVLCNQTGLSPICINAEDNKHLVLPVTHRSGYIRRYTRGTHYCNQIKNVLGKSLPTVMLYLQHPQPMSNSLSVAKSPPQLPNLPATLKEDPGATAACCNSITVSWSSMTEEQWLMQLFSSWPFYH